LFARLAFCFVAAAKNQALLDAAIRRNFEFVELLLKLGADICSVPFSDVLLSRAPS
jgi:AAA+ superfamily predicted ATPase